MCKKFVEMDTISSKMIKEEFKKKIINCGSIIRKKLETSLLITFSFSMSLMVVFYMLFLLNEVEKIKDDINVGFFEEIKDKYKKLFLKEEKIHD